MGGAVEVPAWRTDGPQGSRSPSWLVTTLLSAWRNLADYPCLEHVTVFVIERVTPWILAGLLPRDRAEDPPSLPWGRPSLCVVLLLATLPTHVKRLWNLAHAREMIRAARPWLVEAGSPSQRPQCRARIPVVPHETPVQPQVGVFDMFVRTICPTLPHGPRVFRFLSRLLVAAATLGVAAQDAPLALRTVVAEDGDMLALPAVASGVGSEGRMAVEVATEGGIRTWRVSYRGRTYTAHAAEDARPTRRVFDPVSRRFRVVEPVLRVDVDDPERLPALVRELGAVSAKAYPGLGFALIRLAPGSDPIDARDRLASGGHGVSASLQLRPPIRRPTYVPRPGDGPVPRGAAAQVASSKTDLKADLLVFFNGTRVVSETAVDAEVDVYNWGAADSEAGTLEILLASDPDFEDVVQRESRQVPALEAKGGYSSVVPLPIGGLAPNAVYYLAAYMEEQDSEFAGRGYTNQDFSGFRLDASGRVQVRCREPGRGGSPGVEDPLRAQQWHLSNTGQAAWAENGGKRNEDLRLGTLVGSRLDGSGVRVAVVDTGMETCHPDLAAAVEPGASFNFNVGNGPAADWNAALADDPFQRLPSRRPRHKRRRPDCRRGQERHRRSGGGAGGAAAGLQLPQRPRPEHRHVPRLARPPARSRRTRRTWTSST